MPHTRPETPRSVTHTHDEDYSDEDDGKASRCGCASGASNNSDETD